MNWLQRLFVRVSARIRREPAYQPIFWTLESVHLARAYYIVAELAIADHLRNGPMTCEALAEVTGSQAGSLRRVMRALAAFGVFRCDRQGRFHLTRRAWPLLDGVPGSVRHWVLLTGRAETWQAYRHALDTVRSGNCGFEIAHGADFYRYCDRHAELDSVFIKGMSGWTDWQSRVLIDAYDFSRFAKVVDVGGGRGSLIREILRRHPGVRGVLYDRPESIEAARTYIEQAGLSSHCDLVPGDFLKKVPTGGDVYVIKHVLRDWDDEDALRILTCCREAMGAQATLLIIDATLDPRNNKDRLLKLIDLEQMALLSGALRTRDELAGLVQQAGFQLRKTIPTAVVDASILEARKI
jgi:hypothetical protein